MDDDKILSVLLRIERLLQRMVPEPALPPVKPLVIEMTRATPKPPTQGIGVVGASDEAFGNTSSPPVLTDDMKLIAKLVFEPEVRAYLAGVGNFKLNEQVQVARNQCQRFVLTRCGVQDYRLLIDGEPAVKLHDLLRDIAGAVKP